MKAELSENLLRTSVETNETQAQAMPAHAERKGTSGAGTLRLLSHVQPKLMVGQINDPLEDEADRIADQVISIPEPQIAAVSPQISGKYSSCEEQGEGGAQQLQARRDASGTAAGYAPAVVTALLGSPGRPLEAGARGFMEPRLGHDLSEVRIHTGSLASRSAEAVMARAYTVGRNIVFGDGEYAPGTPQGRHLLAHELAHVLQQGPAAAPVPGTSRPGQATAVGSRVQRQDDAPPEQGSVADLDQEYQTNPSPDSAPAPADAAAAGPSVDYILGYDDGWAGNPKPGGQSADYYQGYDDGLAAANPPMLPSGQLSYAQLMGLWQDAGGGSPDIAAAIAVAESWGGYPGIIQQGQPYATTGWGLWQITAGNSVPDVGVDFQLLNPFLNSQAAVQKWKQAGSFHPWTTYNNGDYQKNLLSGVSPDSTGVIDLEYEPYGRPSPIAPKGTHNRSA